MTKGDLYLFIYAGYDSGVLTEIWHAARTAPDASDGYSVAE